MDKNRLTRLGTAELHRAFLEALGAAVSGHSDPTQKPLEMDLVPPLPHRVRLYLFNATHPPGGRTLGEHKIQLAVPGQGRDQIGSFDLSGGRIVLLAGHEVDTGVFILWDAALYPRFSFSRNVQVKAQTVYQALAGGVGRQERRLRGFNSEIVLTARAPELGEAIRLRVELARDRVLARRTAVHGVTRNGTEPSATIKSVFLGTLGTRRVLIDANTGKVLVRLARGMRPKDTAEAKHLVLVPRSEAEPQAAKRYERAWRLARNG